jgi:hypothetical protein
MIVSMSTDEIRTQKGLALLEFKEAEENLHALERRKDLMANAFRKFAGCLESEAREECRQNAQLTAQSALDLLDKIAEARTKFVAAEEKKSQFGL